MRLWTLRPTVMKPLICVLEFHPTVMICTFLNQNVQIITVGRKFKIENSGFITVGCKSQNENSAFITVGCKSQNENSDFITVGNNSKMKIVISLQWGGNPQFAFGVPLK